ncbi:hypothetical protein [Paracoccus sp. (in: a-proteobacteria)]|uniref:hypothetical protein n=1 Tax=Paracoccus sp. TaxID=267 RepID=UPI0026DF3B66|nr:hypothetical protein [Paracoccus sp. (in: a-proteobacteria)]MDO5646732.1 hypothetical protein [Paracoccus sp. (in: a-proteobacteria)]
MMRGLALIAVMPLAVLVTACGPIPVEQAERACLRNAELAVAPRSQVHMGISTGSGGPRVAGGFKVEMSSDYIAGRDPAEVYDRCVMRRSGQMPNRPLTDYPGWRRS